MSIKKAIKRWYEGEYIPPDNPPGELIIFFQGTHRRHWSSRCVHAIIDFSRREWRWLVPLIVSLVVAAVAVVKLSGN